MIPALVETHQVLVPDLSGHGDSGRRDAYRPEHWESEMAAVVADAGLDSVRVVAHSMGGLVTTHFVTTHPDLVEAAVIIETPFREPAPDGKRPRWRRHRRPARVYDSVEDALARFRFVPDQPVIDAELTEVVARRSITPVEGGYTWKADPQVYGRFDDRELLARLRRLRTPLAYVYGEHSVLCDGGTAAFLREQVPNEVTVVELADGHHHVVIDRPAACVEVALGLLAERCASGLAGQPDPA